MDIVRHARPRNLPPAHVGVNAGPIYEEGDYFGRAVNAARIAAKAGADLFVGEHLAGVVEPSGFVLRDLVRSEGNLATDQDPRGDGS